MDFIRFEQKQAANEDGYVAQSGGHGYQPHAYSEDHAV